MWSSTLIASAGPGMVFAPPITLKDQKRSSSSYKTGQVWSPGENLPWPPPMPLPSKIPIYACHENPVTSPESRFRADGWLNSCLMLKSMWGFRFPYSSSQKRNKGDILSFSSLRSSCRQFLEVTWYQPRASVRLEMTVVRIDQRDWKNLRPWWNFWAIVVTAPRSLPFAWPPSLMKFIFSLKFRSVWVRDFCYLKLKASSLHCLLWHPCS